MLRVLTWLVVLAPAVALAQSPNCVPSCEVDDGRFLAITDGAGLQTLTDQILDLQIESPGGGFELGFFDGETSGVSGFWDLNSPGSVPQLTFSLYADPDADGAGDALVATYDGEAMVDNGWSTFAVDDVNAARTPTGDYLYLLRAELGGLLNPGVRSVFKVQTGADVRIEVFQQPFAFIAALKDFPELPIIYPACLPDLSNFPACTGLPDPPSCSPDDPPSTPCTTYDGDFRFFLTVQDPQQELVIWDGDLDRGDWDGANPDGDDFNTGNLVTDLPPWACEPREETDPVENCAGDEALKKLPSVNLEGVATGLFPSTGDPPDDFNPADVGFIWIRRGPVSYEVWGPDARLLAVNDDPSGNQEWERFRLSVVDDGDADAVVDELPAGIYEIRVKNLDLENLNAFRFGVPAVTEPNCDEGRPTGLTFIYTADSCSEPAASNNSQGGLPGTSGDYECAGPLTTGDKREVRLVPVKKPERFEMVPESAFPGEQLTIRAKTKNDRLFPHTELEVQDALTGEVLQEVTLHTSCSQPLIVGEQFGSLKLFAFFLKF